MDDETRTCSRMTLLHLGRISTLRPRRGEVSALAAWSGAPGC
jgi:hypothetical protein